MSGVATFTIRRPDAKQNKTPYCIAIRCADKQQKAPVMKLEKNEDFRHISRIIINYDRTTTNYIIDTKILLPISQ